MRSSRLPAAPLPVCLVVGPDDPVVDSINWISRPPLHQQESVTAEGKEDYVQLELQALHTMTVFLLLLFLLLHRFCLKICWVDPSEGSDGNLG